MTNASPAYHLRPFQTIDDFRACVALQEETWGHGFSERVSAAILQVSQHLGGVAAGAYDPSGRLLGFVFGMTGIDAEGALLHWSDMLAVRPHERDGGLGRRLKLYQREQVLERGVERMIWTWDPLQSRNAYLNLMKLGVISREYRRDMYGETDSVLHRGIGTDRLLALWLLTSERVVRRITNRADPEALTRAGAAVALGSRRRAPSGDPAPTDPDTALEESVISVAIPASLDDLRERDLALAVAWRQATRVALEAYLGRGFEIRELTRDGDVSHYLMSPRSVHAD